MPPIITKGIVITDNCCDKTNFYNTFADFPTTGTQNRLYVDKTTFSIYIWDVITEAYIPTTPEPLYKVYKALLTQDGTSPPVDTVLENTLGTITYQYNATGNYNILSDGLFTEFKTALIIPPSIATRIGIISFTILDSNTINLLTTRLLTGAEDDSLLLNSFIQIEVYP